MPIKNVPLNSRLAGVHGLGIIVVLEKQITGFVEESPAIAGISTGQKSFWGRRLQKNVLKAYQASLRGGTLHIRYHPHKVAIGGQTVVIMQGEMNGLNASFRLLMLAP